MSRLIATADEGARLILGRGGTPVHEILGLDRRIHPTVGADRCVRPPVGPIPQVRHLLG
ncbi:MAG: hypothetical protein WHS46_00575 [Desulfosoma sp.]